jgi:adenosine deaminase CECR1
MGTFCSKIGEEDYPDQQHEKQSEESPSKLHKRLHPHYRGSKMAARARLPGSAVEVSLDMGDYLKTRDTRLDFAKPGSPLIYVVDEDYEQDRNEIMRRGESLAFDHRLTYEAGHEEREANERLEIVKWNDRISFYDDATPLEGFGGQKHRRFPGDHFLSNADLLETTGLFKIARGMPKGAHLHIHFNACLLPHVLLDIAETMESMYISSNLPLVSETNLNICEIQFLIRNITDVKKERTVLLEKEMARRTSENDLTLEELKTKARNERNLLHKDYKYSEGRQGEWMEYRLFIDQWNNAANNDWKIDPQMAKFANVTSKSWLTSKLVFSEQEAHHPEQTVHG